jgi:serine/threonine-protein kinase
LFVRSVDRFDATKLPGTEAAEGPFFSPDGRHIGFWTQSKLKRIDVDGGSVADICDAPDSRGAVWSDDDTIIFTPGVNTGLSRVSASGGTPQALTTLDPSLRERTHRFPEAIKGSKAVLYVSASTDIEAFTDAQIIGQVLPNGARSIVVQGGIAPHVADGKLFYYRSDGLVSVPFDATQLKVTGTPERVTADVAEAINFGTVNYGVSREGRVAYLRGGELQLRKTIVTIDRNGQRTPAFDQARFYNAMRVSPDGSRVLLWDQAANDRLSVLDIGRQTLSRLTYRGNVTGGSWMPDGKSVVTVIGSDLVRVAADGSGNIEPLLANPTQKTLTDASPDGDTIALSIAQPGNGFDIWLYSIKSKKTEPWAATRFNERAPRFSPDGKWIAYESDEDGPFDVFVRPRSGAGKIRVSSDGGRSVVWSRDGRSLFFKRGDDVYEAQIQTTTGTATPPRRLFTVAGGPGNSLDLIGDGTRFIALESAPSPLPTLIDLIIGGAARK